MDDGNLDVAVIYITSKTPSLPTSNNPSLVNEKTVHILKLNPHVTSQNSNQSQQVQFQIITGIVATTEFLIFHASNKSILMLHKPTTFLPLPRPQLSIAILTCCWGSCPKDIIADHVSGSKTENQYHYLDIDMYRFADFFIFI